MELVRLTREGAVGILTMAHEEQNRFTTDFLGALIDALTEFEKDEAVRGVVVTQSQEKFFCTGLHLEWVIEEGAKGPDAMAVYMERLRSMYALCCGYPKPLVGAIGGHVAAAGFVFAACLDYRLMNADRGKVRLPEVHMNLEFLPGTMAIIKDILSPQAVRDFLYGGRAFTAAEAHAMGFIDRLLPAAEVLPAAIDMARELGYGQLPTYAGIKRELRRNVLRTIEEDDRVYIDGKVAELRAAFTPRS